MTKTWIESISSLQRIRIIILFTIIDATRVSQGSAVAQWKSVGLRSERSGVRDLPPPCVSLSKTLYSPKVLVNYPGSDGSVPT